MTTKKKPGSEMQTLLDALAKPRRSLAWRYLDDGVDAVPVLAIQTERSIVRTGSDGVLTIIAGSPNGRAHYMICSHGRGARLARSWSDVCAHVREITGWDLAADPIDVFC